jgi:hypothetical protein
MPIYEILCPDCGHLAKSLVLAGCRMPERWACSVCGGERAHPDPATPAEQHPWELGHGAGCLCCGGVSREETALTCAGITTAGDAER